MVGKHGVLGITYSKSGIESFSVRKCCSSEVNPEVLSTNIIDDNINVGYFDNDMHKERAKCFDSKIRHHHFPRDFLDPFQKKKITVTIMATHSSSTSTTAPTPLGNTDGMTSRD